MQSIGLYIVFCENPRLLCSPCDEHQTWSGAGEEDSRRTSVCTEPKEFTSMDSALILCFKTDLYFKNFFDSHCLWGAWRGTVNPSLINVGSFEGVQWYKKLGNLVSAIYGLT
jgi:hypothetical protein